MTETSLSPPAIGDADWLRQPETQAVFKALECNGHAVRAVGGAVRNTLMGMPAADIDLATTATPDEVIQLAKNAGLAAVPTGIEHGTITVIANHIPFEVTTLREDVKTFGRHAEVAFTRDWTADARRRDFTMNALYCSADGTVHDLVGGYADLLARRVRFIGSAEDRIREDYLRILRFFRFFAQYGRSPADIDSEGLEASTRLAPGLDNLSAERIRQELLRLLAAPGAAMAVRLMHEADLLARILRRVPRLMLSEQVMAIEQACNREPDPVLRLALLAVETPEDAAEVAQLLRLSGDERQTLRDIAEFNSLTVIPTEQDAKVLLYQKGPDRYQRLVMAAWARSGAAAEDANWHAIITLPERWQIPTFPLKGADVISAGLPAGPAVGELIRTLEQDWIQSGFTLDRAALHDALRAAILERQRHL